MDLELLSDEEKLSPVEPGQVRVETDMDTSPERRQRSRSRRITFLREDELETVAVITPRSQQRGQPVDTQEIIGALMNDQHDMGQSVAAGSAASPARCLQLLVGNNGEAARTSSPGANANASNDQPAAITPRRRKSSVFEMDEPEQNRSRQRMNTQEQARVLQLWGCGYSSGAKLSQHATPMLPSSEEACRWVHQAWGWSLPGAYQKQPQGSSREKDELREGTEEPSSGTSEQQRAKVLSDWGCIPTAEEGVPPPASAGRCNAGGDQQKQCQQSSYVQSWNAVTEQIVATYLAH